MSREEITSKLKCPKCKCNSINITEYWQNRICFTQENGIIDLNDGDMEHGEVTKLYAICNNCEYEWRVRALQITDLKKG